MNIDIENINTFEKRNKVYTNKWRTIYEVIEPEFFYKSVGECLILNLSGLK